MTEPQDQHGPWAAGEWLNSPPSSCIEGNVLTVTTGQATDFWRTTHYGFVRDSGHFLGLSAPSRFTAQVRIKAAYEQLYYQAGLMVRLDERRWVKAGVEFSDGYATLSSVLTDERSDWATAPFHGDAADFWLRATVDDGVLRLQVSTDGRLWSLMRLAPFPASECYRVGPMCCTPERAGLIVRFSEWMLGPPLGKALHDLS